MIDPFGSTIAGTRAALVALDVALKATALMTLAFACHGVLGRGRALVRSALWNACFVGLLLIPAAGLALPRFYVTVPSARAPSFGAAPLRDATDPADALPEEPPSVTSSPIGRDAIGPFETQTVREPAPNSPVSSRPWLGGVDMAFGVYLAIASLLAIRLAATLAGVVRLTRRCLRVEDARWAEALARWRVRLGITRRVALLATNRLSVPVVVGWMRPAILLPEGLIASANPGLIDAVLLHELGHIRRGDFGWNIVRKLVQLVYWPHPLVWPVGRIVDRVREQACDDLCVHGLGGPAAYRASLIEVASGLVRRPDASLGLAMARPTNLGLRLAWIDRTRGASRCLLRWPGRLSLALAVAIAAGALGSIEFARAAAKAAGPVEDRKAEPVPEQPPSIEVIVRAKDSGRPLAGASVRPTIDLVHSTLKADRDGRVRVDLSKRRFRDTFNIDVWAEGYVQQRHFFAQNDARFPKIPSQVTIDLLPGEQTLGGRVVDEQGRPIVGARVDIWGYLGEKKQKEEGAYMVEATTDDQGRWRCRCFRAMQFAHLYLRHPDFLADNEIHPRRHGRPRPTDAAHAEEKPMETLRDFSDVQVMTRGVEVAGEVRDERGRPIPGAEVGWFGADQHDTFHHDIPTTAADAAGRFRFPHVRAGRVVLQVMAKGHAPELKPVEAKAGAGPVAVTLGAARTLEGRVVDSRGEPIPDAFIAIDAWRTYRSLGVFLKSDADGTFRWEGAPPDSVLINASRPGFASVTPMRASPDEKALFSLRRSLSISGTVRDAKTKKGIDSPFVEFGTPDPKTGAYTWGEKRGVFAFQGRLQADIDVERTPEFRLRIRAKRYEPFESRTFRVGEPQSELNVDLTPADTPDGVVVAGVVTRRDGAPLAGADVAITYPMAGGSDRLPAIRIRDGKLQADELVTPAKTDSMGRFRLTREPDPRGRSFAVVVVHPEYYAEVDRPAIEADPTIVAKPWSRVEGIARVGGRPAAGAAIRYFADRLGNRDVPRVSDSGVTKADAQGRFVVERVVPGDVRVSSGFGEGGDAKGWSYGVLLEVKPGEIGRAELGGTGRPVIARVTPPPGFDPNGDYTANSRFEIVSDRPNIPYPKELLANRDASMVEWGKRWWASAEGHEYRRKTFRYSEAKLQEGGTIRVDDVPPGEYRLTLAYSADALRGVYSAPERIAHATKQFTIPEIPGGRSDEPFDLGLLHPRPKQTLTVGQPAPPFDVETLDGGRSKLADFRGKYLLVDFWATWCGPCIAEVPELKAVHDRFGKDGRFAMLSLSLDAAKDAPRRFVAEKGLAWKQGFLGEWVDGGVTDAYHVETIPAIFLIGPDGTVKATGLRGDTIGAAISEAFEKP